LTPQKGIEGGRDYVSFQKKAGIPGRLINPLTRISHRPSVVSQNAAQESIFPQALASRHFWVGIAGTESAAEGAENGRNDLFVRSKNDFKHGSARPVVWVSTSSVG
jgi:hypothetical protein